MFHQEVVDGARPDEHVVMVAGEETLDERLEAVAQSSRRQFVARLSARRLTT
jgi:hypothetical protein